MKNLIQQTMDNDLFGVSVKECETFEDSYIIYHKSSDYPFCTVYKDVSGYSVYEATNDEWAGIEIEDERLKGCGMTVNKAVNTIKTLQKSIFGSDDYAVFLESWEGKLLQPAHSGFRVSGHDSKSDDYETIFDRDVS